MLRRWTIGLTSLLVAGVTILYLTQGPMLQVATAYAAKCGCTNVYAADRNVTEIKQTDLNYSLLKYASLAVDTSTHSVTASLVGLSSSTAVWKEGFGCLLLDGSDDYHITYPSAVLHTDKPSNAWSIERCAQSLAIQRVVDRYMDEQWQSRAIIVARQSDILGEAYASGITQETPLLGWSLTKTIANALVGIMVQDSLLALDQDDLFVAWQDDDRATITLDQLMRMTSGLQWREQYSQVSPATDMLFKTENIFSLALQQKAQSDPGSGWTYSSGTSNLLSGLIRQTINNDSTYWQMPKERLFRPLGMSSAFIEPDESGHFILSSYGYATARDWARFGLLYLNDGVVDGIRILPQGWIAYSTSLTPSSASKYGAHLWVNHKQLSYPSAPADLFAAQGYQGQYVFVIPSLDLVVVRIGLSSSWPADDFLAAVCAVLQ